MIIIISIIIVFILICLWCIYTDPVSIIILFSINLKQFRLHKDKGKYYIQIRLFWTWYYIHKFNNEYTLYLWSDYYTMIYSNDLIFFSNKQVLLEERDNIIKYFKKPKTN